MKKKLVELLLLLTIFTGGLVLTSNEVKADDLDEDFDSGIIFPESEIPFLGELFEFLEGIDFGSEEFWNWLLR